MEEIIVRQHDAAKPLTGKGFVLGVAGILLRLAIAQIAVNLLISMTGLGLLNLAFYGYAVLLLVAFMRRTVASYVYTLKRETLVLERRMGDSPSSVVQIPLANIISMRPVYMGERLHTTYRQVTEIDPAGRPPFRVRAAFVLSLISAKLARLAAGKRVEEQIGHVLVFEEDRQTRACVFCPQEKLRVELEARLGDAYGFDERMTRAKLTGVWARALERAFPALYPYVDPLVKQEQVEWARAEIEREKAEKQAAKKTPRKDGKALNQEKAEDSQPMSGEADASAAAGSREEDEVYDDSL
ncbi:MAG: hypothetical protein IJD94_03090 [Clostridia bacterium]|nr:hypothetical protein [Clostridia bacterium]